MLEIELLFASKLRCFVRYGDLLAYRSLPVGFDEVSIATETAFSISCYLFPCVGQSVALYFLHSQYGMSRIEPVTESGPMDSPNKAHPVFTAAECDNAASFLSCVHDRLRPLGSVT